MRRASIYANRAAQMSFIEIKLLRVSAAGELEGFDLDQHGASAYPEYVISTLTKSHSVGGDREDKDNALASAPMAAK